MPEKSSDIYSYGLTSLAQTVSIGTLNKTFKLIKTQFCSQTCLFIGEIHAFINQGVADCGYRFNFVCL